MGSYKLSMINDRISNSRFKVNGLKKLNLFIYLFVIRD